MLIVTGASGFVGHSILLNANKPSPIGERPSGRQNDMLYVAMGRDKKKLNNRFYKTPKNKKIELYEYVLGADENINFFANDKIAKAAKDSEDDIVLIHAAGEAHRRDLKKEDYDLGITGFSKKIFNGFVNFLKSVDRSGMIINMSSIAARDPEKASRKFLRYYGEAKRETEAMLSKLQQETKADLSAVSLRCPAIWGDKAIGSFAMVNKIIDIGLPLPIRSIKTRRPYLNIETLNSAINEMILLKSSGISWPEHHVIEFADEHLQISQIVNKISQIKKTSVITFPFPPLIISITLKSLNLNGLHDQLFQNIDMDESAYKIFINNIKNQNNQISRKYRI